MSCLYDLIYKIPHQVRNDNGCIFDF